MMNSFMRQQDTSALSLPATVPPALQQQQATTPALDSTAVPTAGATGTMHVSAATPLTPVPQQTPPPTLPPASTSPIMPPSTELTQLLLSMELRHRPWVSTRDAAAARLLLGENVARLFNNDGMPTLWFRPGHQMMTQVIHEFVRLVQLPASELSTEAIVDAFRRENIVMFPEQKLLAQYGPIECRAALLLMITGQTAYDIYHAMNNLHEFSPRDAIDRFLEDVTILNQASTPIRRGKANPRGRAACLAPTAERQGREGGRGRGRGRQGNRTTANDAPVARNTSNANRTNTDSSQANNNHKNNKTNRF